MYILALFFTLVYLAISYRNLALMIHSAPSFPVAALLYLPISLVLTWFAARRLKRNSTSAFGRTMAMLALGCTLSVAGWSMWWLAITADMQLHARKEAAVEVTQTEESILRSRSGNPIGLKLVFTARVPRYDYYSFREPNMGISEETVRILGKNFSGMWPGHALVMGTYREEIAPPLEKPGFYEEGVTYTLTYYLIPSYVVDSVADPMPCLWVPGNFPRDKWEFLLNSELDGTYRLAPLIGAYEPRRETHGRYSQKMFFDGLRKEGLSFCPPEGGSPKRLTAFPGIF